MEVAIEFAKILLPSGLILYAMYLTIRSFLNKERDEKILEIKTRNAETIVPLRLQAYERMVLFLERISPNNLIIRLNKGQLSSSEFQHVLINEIREEFGHNMSQQLYMSEEAWELVKNAKEEVISLINKSAGELNGQSTAMDLSKVIFNTIVENQIEPTTTALKYVKDEIRSIF